MKNICKISGIIVLAILCVTASSKISLSAIENTKISTLKTVEKDKDVIQVNQPEINGYQLIAGNPSKGVFVYGKKLDSQPYFNQVLVKTNTSQKLFNWKATTKNPQLLFANIIGSGEENIIIVFVTASGTGIYESQVHVLNMSLTNEIPIEDPALAARRLITARTQGNEIVFNTGEKEYRIKPSVGAEGTTKYLKNIQYGNVVIYSVENNKLKATVSVQGNSSIDGEFTLIYSNKDGKLVPEVTNFKKF